MSKRLVLVGGILLVVAIVAVMAWQRRTPADPAEYAQLVNRGNSLLENGDTAGAIERYTQALRRSPESIDVRLNLANAYLAASRPDEVPAICRQVLDLDANNAAAHYLLGCALLRQNQPEPASEAFQQAWKIDPGEPALDFQMAMAQQQLGHVDDAIRLFESVIRAVPDHPSAHYQLSQLYRRSGRTADAAQALAEHQKILAKNPAPMSVAELERCKYTRLLAPFVLAQPARDGIAVAFTDATDAVLGALAADSRAPLAVIDYDRDGRPSLFARDARGAFVLLDNRDGRFALLGRPLRAPAPEGYRSVLVGDLDNDGIDDVVVPGEQDTRVFKFYEHGRMRDATRAVGLEGVKAAAGILADLDFTGNLDLVIVPPDHAGLGLYRNLGNFYFDPNWSDSGLPRSLHGATQVMTADWDNEGLPGVFVARSGSPPSFFAKKRAAAFAASDDTTRDWPAGHIIEIGDLDNDLRAEAVIASSSGIAVVDREQADAVNLTSPGFAVSALQLIDYDNDGWLDLLASGPSGVRVWRNGGHAGFRDVTGPLGLDKAGAVDGMAIADFDGDGDSDLVTSSDTGLRFWRNDGGNAHRQLKLRLTGNRSNGSALGVRVDVVAGDWRTSRIARRMPMEIGVGTHASLDAIKVHWFDLATTQVDVPVTAEAVTIAEPTLPSGSCPYLYAWDGHAFRFVTDILGAAPLGLPLSESRFVAADPEELLALGDASQFPPRGDAYEIRLTEELREALYLDEVHLIAIDHPAGTVVHPTSKMLPGPPFPKHELWTLRPIAAPVEAVRNDGLDVTATLARADRDMVAPVELRRAQLRGLAEPHAVTLGFGGFPQGRPLVLALTGWIRFGGGMANIAGSVDPTLPFPFPVLEAERPDGSWVKLDVAVGTPAGKTKTILVDLDGVLPPETRRLRLSTAFEIYWDCIQLCERLPSSASTETVLPASTCDLRWRGYSRYAELPPSLPLTPQYDNVSPVPPWDRTPGGWFTRYGSVGELVRASDDRLALLAGGDELALSFDAGALASPAPGMVRDFFLHAVGWDKDADFHVEQGWRLEPLPFHGMDDQEYGREPRPAHLDDAWIREYNTRWVSPVVPSPGNVLRQVP